MPLHALTLLYLLTPCFIFLFGWLTVSLALSVSIAILYTAYQTRGRGTISDFSKQDLVILAVLSLAWTLTSGAGGFGHQNSDWAKHNAVLKDLIFKPWPVMYDVETGELGVIRHPLVYYLAYYLPAAAVGKALGWIAANVVLSIWTWTGIFLALAWVKRLSGRYWVAALFIFLSGLDGPGHWFLKHDLFKWTSHIEWWAHHWQYSSNTSLVVWVPQHALGGWLATSLILDGWYHKTPVKTVPLEWAAAAFWSPFASIGLIPFAMLRAVEHPWELLTGWKDWIGVLPWLALLYLYYSASQPVPQSWLTATILGPDKYTYVFFVVMEFGLFAGLVAAAGPSRREQWVLGLVTVVLLAIPFYRMGLYNDFGMRASIPALFALWILVGFALLKIRGKLRVALVVAMILGAVTPGTELLRSFAHFQFRPPNIERVHEVHSAHSNKAIGAQYLGTQDSFFFSSLAKETPF